jgi:pimeloyl-ACP methyl ester carboxylesterase
VPTRLRTRSRSTVPALGLVVFALVAAACGNPEQQTRDQALKDSKAVTFPAKGGVRLAGRLFGSSSDAAGVVLAAAFTSDQQSWFDYADRLASAGYRTLTFDYRGVCPKGEGGCSGGTRDPDAMTDDIASALTYLRSLGTLRTAVIGAIEGGTAALIVASQPQQSSQGLGSVITLSAPQSAFGLAAGADVVQAITVAKRFIAGESDVVGDQAAEAFYDESLPPKAVTFLTTADRGTDLLSGDQGEQARNAIMLELEQYVPTTSPSASP